MELLQLKYFCDAAQTENLSRTARKFLVPTSSISQSIKRLENELGCELFEHRANKIYLNSAGRQFYENVSQALFLLESARDCVLESDELKGDIHMICMSNRRIVTSAIEELIQKHPQVNFIIHHSMDTEQEYDVFIADSCPYEYSEKILVVDENICIAMNKNHSFASKADFSISDLANERFITMTPSSSLYKITAGICADAGFVPNIAIQTDDPFYLRKYIEMGLGIAFVPENSWRGLFDDKIVLKRVGNIQRKTYAYLPKRKRIKRPVEIFLQILNDRARLDK
ncbi:MAG: LysR family transcriptional regulator [Clostridia bacterium]|nr:LysR family transcriptional regulator [Clostridia bacterium]